jgi:hypothetical protein
VHNYADQHKNKGLRDVLIMLLAMIILSYASYRGSGTLLALAAARETRPAALQPSTVPSPHQVNPVAQNSSTDARSPTAVNAATGSFTGTVTGPDGVTPLAGIEVLAYRQVDAVHWEIEKTVTTGADGAYTASGLTADDIYRAWFRDPTGAHVSEYYDDVDKFEDGQRFNVLEGQTTPHINAALADAGYIAGTITENVSGEPVADIAAKAWYSTTTGWQSAGTSVSNADGTYTIGGLGPGAYRVNFSDPYPPPRYLAEVYDNVLTLAEGVDVTVAAGQTTGNIDAALGAYGSITGTVTEADNQIPIAGILVTIYEYDSSTASWAWASEGTTDDTGSYTAPGLETGHYHVEFYDPQGQYTTEYYNDQLSLNTATTVTVDLGLVTPKINASLALKTRVLEQSLNAGWNLISLPVPPDDPAVAAAFGTIDGNYSLIYAYDTDYPAPYWAKYDPDDPGSALQQVDIHHGYWIDMAISDTLTITGTYAISTVITLDTGWNLIGFPSSVEKPVSEVLAPIAGQYTIIWGYEATDTADPWKKYDPAVPAFLNDLEMMQPWYGYWIDVTDPTTLTLSSR